MSRRNCPLSLRPLDDDESFDRNAAKDLFGKPQIPAISVEMAKLHTVGLAMVGRASLSGAQRKLSVGLDSKHMTLAVAADGRQYILKPPSDRFPALPENEHVTMRIADACGLHVARHGLIELADGARAYIVDRFDRTLNRGKLRMEEVCQLAEQYPADKYRGSAELCSRLVGRHANETVIAQLHLFTLLLFGWWTGNGDMHLKNVALLADSDGRHRLSPAYDLLCTRLVINNDPLALPVGGKRSGLTARTWRDFATYCGLAPPVAARVCLRLAGGLDEALGLVQRSFLPDEQKASYRALLEERVNVLKELTTGR